ncbi:hypothetical protein C4561_02755 [candidate division WWE3 bacterium]|uniref:Uncharacterized protein n=1 Tax=candidate division WWE3 bacterium TaxID=2053526 RepID=A0A3A4ZDP1_UNCKA|nr:MAG: hypothetical protein C4561_02755 [candidate division WWE3 bacterium]
MKIFKWWPWLLSFVVIWLLQFWPGGLGPLIGRPYNNYMPLILGWIPGWFFYTLVMYFVGFVWLLLFSLKFLWPLLGEEDDKL